MSNRTFTISLVMLLIALCAGAALSFRTMPIVVQTNLEKLPMVISGYTATEDSFSDAVYKELNADKNVYRHYKSQNGDRLDLYIGYYGTAKGGRTGHNPYACLPGVGAAIVDTDVVHLKQAVSGKNVPVNYILSRNGGDNTVMLHWYQTAGKTVVATGFKQNVERFKGKILHNRNDGAFVRITTNSTDGDIHLARKRAERFAETILNLLSDYWPLER